MIEGVVKIWINSQPCKGINLTTRHTWATKATRVATVHNEAKHSGRVLPHPNVVFHAYALADTLWVAQTLFHCTPVKRGKVSSNLLTHEATKFGNSICPVTEPPQKWGARLLGCRSIDSRWSENAFKHTYEAFKTIISLRIMLLHFSLKIIRIRSRRFFKR
jgi:hypothetical protein